MPTLAAANTAAPSPRELMAVLATVDELVLRAADFQRTAQELQKKLPAMVQSLTEQQAADNTWVRAVAKTPNQVALEHISAPAGSRAWWVVYVGREPGLYSTIEAADAQIKGCPNQQYRRKADKTEALNFYIHKHNEGVVEKWVELTEDIGALNLHH
ncbi:hypothetical protein B0H14DRAFT_2562244 [Mycena olivaceomarginata]|nr:hypothetical protein B0H14DRAFT_2562244 [Mycena olivaceomarginata]